MADCPNIVKGEKRREKSHFHLLLSLSLLTFLGSVSIWLLSAFW